MNNWQCGRFLITFDKPKIMGIVNITPDSFYDGNTYSRSIKNTLMHCEKLVKEGCDILDIGGESTRPGSNNISLYEEWNRVYPILKEISTWSVPISLDTKNALIMDKALSKGYVDIINDISALSDKDSLSIISNYPNIGLCIMHMKGEPNTMQLNPKYTNVIYEVSSFLQKKVTKIVNSGIEKNRIVIDPGIGFGKFLQHNISLLKSIPDLKNKLSLPILIGVSRKSVLGEIIRETDPKKRMIPSIAILPNLFNLGVDIIRVHDVKESIQALKIWSYFK